MNKKVRMDEYCSSVRDGTHDTPKPTPIGFPLVTSRAINNNSIDFNTCYFISNEDYDKINKRSQVDKWDVLMTMIGTVGRLFLVRTQPEYAIKNIALFKVGDEERAKWLYYYLSNKSVQDYFEMIASGTSQHFIGLGHLRKLKIDDFNTSSKAIVNILSTYDGLIENNNKRIALLEKAAQELYKEWFVRFRFPGHEKAKFINGLPEGWEVKRMKDIVEVGRGSSPRPITDEKYFIDGQIPWIKIADATASKVFIFKTKEHVNEYGASYSRRLKPGSLILTASGTLGFPMFLAVEGCIHDGWLYFSEFSTVPTEYIYYVLYSLRDYFNNLSYGAAIQNINTDIVRKSKVIVPKEETLKSFMIQISNIHEQIKLLVMKNQNLIKQRELLLPRLMSGKLEV